MSNLDGKRRVVITGMAVVSPLGKTLEALWDALAGARSGIRHTSRDSDSQQAFELYAPATDFKGKIDDFGPLEPAQKKAIRKGLKLMCREISMGVAAAQLALTNARLQADAYTPERSGVVYGCDHIVTLPQEFSGAIEACSQNGDFEFGAWGTRGLNEVTPLWLLKYLPNMPASHIAIYNDLRGPNNSLTYREASSNVAIGEAYETIRRGSADMMIAGATGSSIAPLRAVQLSLVSPWCLNGVAPDQASRPFEAKRTGMVAGEGAAAIVLESLEAAEARGATIVGEILGHGSSTVIDQNSAADPQRALQNAMRNALRSSALAAENVGHVHAHGNGTPSGDEAEARAIAEFFGDHQPVVAAAKSYFGNLGAASGLVELIASLLAIDHQQLFRTLNYETPDPACPIRLAQGTEHAPGTSVLNLNYTPQGQASAVVASGRPSSARTPPPE
ncbi:MAG: beta-ketoacyl-[acyl-carrier-protein] synthase family protein [Planctomycetota bacterium]